MPVFIVALFTIAKIWKQPKYQSTDEWIKRMWYTHTHTHTHAHDGLLPNHNKEWNVAICNNMNGPGGYYTKWIRSDEDKYCMISLICGI